MNTKWVFIYGTTFLWLYSFLVVFAGAMPDQWILYVLLGWPLTYFVSSKARLLVASGLVGGFASMYMPVRDIYSTTADFVHIYHGIGSLKQAAWQFSLLVLVVVTIWSAQRIARGLLRSSHTN